MTENFPSPISFTILTMIDSVKIGNEIAEQFLRESSEPKTVAIFSGRFQPAHIGHISIYKYLVNMFGSDSVYIGTSNVTDGDKSPFSFSEKKQIITAMFGIPSNKVVQVSDPFKPVEILSKFPENTIYVTAFSEKDDGRLGGKYFKPYNKSTSKTGYRDAGYFVVPPVFNLDVMGSNVSGTQIRHIFSDPKISMDKKKKAFTQLYGKFDSTIFALMIKKLSGISELLTKKIRNPETGNSILVREALGYDKSHPVYKKALLLIREGGSAGHMLHPFENMNLTFGDLKMLIDLGLSGRLNVEAPVTEKLDGQAISVSWKNGKTIFARNKGQLRDFGIGALDVSGIANMFSGRGDLSDAFSFAARDLDSSIRSLSQTQREKIFAEGHKFMSVEIIFPATQNVIPYGTNMLVFHNSVEYDQGGNIIGYGDSEGTLLANMIKQVNADIQKTFKVQGPQIVTLPKSKNFGESKGKYFSKLNQLQSQFRLKDTDAVMKYHDAWWDNFITNKATQLKYPMPNYVLRGLVQRWAEGDTSYSLSQIKTDIMNQSFLDWAISFDKTDSKYQFKENIKPFEILFLSLGAEILSNASGLMAVNPEKSIAQMAAAVQSTSNEIRGSSDAGNIKKLITQLEKLSAIGGESVIAPTEGLVFIFKGQPMKFTGQFAVINQLLGLLKY